MPTEVLQYHIENEEELSHIGKVILDSNKSKIIFLKGDLGAGKTALAKHFCKHLKCTEEISSPTFSLVNEYNSQSGTIFHLDLYRLESTEEALDIGIEDYIYSGNYCFIEWPGIIDNLILEKYIEVNITSRGESSRNLVISFQ